MEAPNSTVTLICSDDVEIVVDRHVAEKSIIINDMLEDLGDCDEAIPIVEVNSLVMGKVLEWCTHHQNDPRPSEDTVAGNKDVKRPKSTKISDPWDQNYIQVEQEMVFQIILAANYLDIKGLLDLGCKAVAQKIEGKTTQQLRDQFGIENDFTPEEEERIRRENEWAEK